MNIFKKLYYKWLAMSDRLSETKFDALCLLCESNDKNAFDVMRTYLSKYVPNDKRMDKLYRHGEKLARLYLEFLYTRSVNEDEQRHLVLFMPFKQGDTWPCELSPANIEELFDTERPYKIRLYATKYALPERFEKLLISRVRTEEEYGCLDDQNSYGQALETYLTENKLPRFKSTASQIFLLSLKDDKYFKFILDSNLSEFVKPETIAEIMLQNRKALLSCMDNLSEALRNQITEKYPDLKDK